mmetsp:Transcript_29554/g.86425  ORF Transcript_29554/g.86425 Transcript_29554/m.86425 type:complete len:278 (-) Transcript_29554:749-1582(-)
MPPRRAGATPRERTERAHWPSGVRTISGCAYAASSASLHEGKRCQHLPARTRPARPRRWWADARETHAGSKHATLAWASYVFSLCLPESITKATSSMVIEDSAMLVAMITLRCPAGGRSKTARCCALGTAPWSACSCRRDDAPDAESAACTLLMSSQPGTNTSTAPSPSVASTATTSAAITPCRLSSSSKPSVHAHATSRPTPAPTIAAIRAAIRAASATAASASSPPPSSGSHRPARRPPPPPLPRADCDAAACCAATSAVSACGTRLINCSASSR